MKLIPLKNKKRAVIAEIMVDDEDYERVMLHTWHRQGCGRSSSLTYAVRNLSRGEGPRTTEYVHRYILNPSPEYVVDHIDGNGLNNTRANLRICTQSNNLKNCKRRSDNIAGFKGIYWDKSKGKWKARLVIRPAEFWCERFDTIEEAKAAYVIAAKKYHGEFARL